MRLEASSICDTGLMRKRNQDSLLVYRNDAWQFGLFLVADGMGGYADGERASNAIAAGLREWLEALPEPGPEMTAANLLLEVRQKLLEINEHIWREWNQGQICGSTCVLLLIYKDDYGVLSVGDSRIYRSRGWTCELITQDDVWENQTEVRGRYTEDELKRHPNYGRLTQAVGNSKDLCCNMQSDKLKLNDIFLMCSDGIYKMCPPGFLERRLRSCRKKTLDKVRDEIMEKVRSGGAKDNASLILVRCCEY